MIKIRIKGSPEHVEGFLIWGHARAGAYGEDIVCAGVSAIATSALMGLAKRMPEGVCYRILPTGLMYCRLSAGLEENEDWVAQIILSTMVQGLEAIKDKHGGFLRIDYRA